MKNLKKLFDLLTELASYGKQIDAYKGDGMTNGKKTSEL